MLLQTRVPTTDKEIDALTERVIGCAIEVHRTLGPGLLESVKAVEHIHPVHLAQVITYLKLTGYPSGLLMNFNSTTLKAGLKRLDHPDRYVKRPS